MGSQLNWLGEHVKQQIAQQAIAALDEIDLRIEGAAKAELYGPEPERHGKESGTLQRSIQAKPARLVGSKVRGSVGTTKLPYAMKIHRRYKYLTIGLAKVRPNAKRILKKHQRRS